MWEPRGGGAWVSADHGYGFSPFADALPVDANGNKIYGPSEAIGALAIDPVNTNPTTVYVATGEGNESDDSYYGIGIYKSGDLGKTLAWLLYPGKSLLSGGTFGHPSFTKLAIDTSHNPPYLFAGGVAFGSSSSRAAAVQLESSGIFDPGLYSSTNGGQTWSQTSSFFDKSTNPPTPAACNPFCNVDDVAVDPISPNDVYVALDTAGVYYSQDSGTTWTAVCSTTNPQCGLPVGRISLATEPPGSSKTVAGTVYAIYGSADNTYYSGFFASSNFGVSWTQRSIPVTQIGIAPNCVIIDGAKQNTTCKLGQNSVSFYNQTIAVSPSDPAEVYFGGIGPYLSMDAGTTWTFLAKSGGTHADQHAAQFDSFTNKLIVGNDGGVYKYDLAAQTWTGINSTISAGQLQSIGPKSMGSGLVGSQKVIAGFQDNGTQAPPTPGANAPWSAVTNGNVFNPPQPFESGDGSSTIYAPSDASYAYHVFSTTAAGPAVSASTDGGNTWYRIVETLALLGPIGNEAAGFYPPMAVNPQSPQNVRFGAHHLFNTLDAMNSWTIGATDLTNPPGGGGCLGTDPSCSLDDLEYSPGVSSTACNTFLWSLSRLSVPNDPQIYTNFCGATYAKTPKAATLAQPTSIVPFGSALTSPTAQQAYLTTSGFDSATGAAAHILLTNDSGNTWVPADGIGGASPLPDIPVLSMLVDNTDYTNNSLIAGTDAGLFSSSNGGATWQGFNMNIVPHVPIFDIRQNAQGAIFVGTHGRGAYRLPPTAHFVQSADAFEEEAPKTGCPTGYPLSTTISPPAVTASRPGPVDGDVLIAAITVGTESPNDVPVLPSGWSFLGFANQSGALSITSGSTCNYSDTTWLVAHLYSTSDTTPYTFSAHMDAVGDSCQPQYCWVGEMQGFVTSYRGADTNLADYTAYGYPNSNSSASTTGQITVGKFSTVLNIFRGANESDDTNGSCETFSAVTGTPPSVTESPLSPDCTQPPYLAADIWTGSSGGNYGPYSAAVSCNPGVCPAGLSAFQVVIPAQP